ncbi:MAG: very short patch repair endonuclease [Acidobacteria bacterium]|nr:very short patch repair endonuclease [Acidobacteriota bacterium]
MDHVSKEVRSKIMAAVRSRGNTTTELPLGKLLWAAGLRGYRKHWKAPGRPDFAWPGRKIAVFVDGCFWHGCPKCKYPPRSNTEFWLNKIHTNQMRDRRVAKQLRHQGWTVLRIWECAVKKPSTLSRIVRALTR